MTDNRKSGTKSAPRRRRAAKSNAGNGGPTQSAANDAGSRKTETGNPAATATKPATPADRDHAAAPPRASRTLATIPIHVRWRDLDAFNHVNNSSYLTFLEESRLQWLRNVPGEWFSEHAMPVMAAVELHYRKPITWPAEVDVLLGCERMGHSSLTIGNRIVARGDPECVYADGNVVMVWVDPTNGASVALPEAIRDVCSSL